jgi:hypothetical protein
MASRNDDTAVGEGANGLSQRRHRRGRGRHNAGTAVGGGREGPSRPGWNTRNSGRMGLGRNGLTTLVAGTVGVNQSA